MITTKPSMATFGVLVAVCLILAIPAISRASTAGELQKAKDKGQVAFVLVTEPGANGVSEAEKVIRAAVKKLGKAVMIRMDRSAPENGSLVSKYRLSGPQIPLVLVFASNGVIAGGGLAEGMETDGLLGMVPTRREGDLIQALQSGRGALVLAFRKEHPDSGDALDSCGKAREKSGGKLAVIQVDMADDAEQAFLQRLRISASSDRPVTVVINARGQITGSFIGPADPRALVAASVKVAGGGCCPGGAKAGAACPPTKKP